MSKAIPSNRNWAANIKFKGKQRTHVFACNCCWCVNDRRALVAAARLKEDMKELDS
jgi:hypothetical protein